MDPPDLTELLRRTYIFGHLASDERALLARACAAHRFHTGETVVRRGDPVDGWHIVQSGRARVTNRAADAPVVPPLVGPGDTFGDRG